LDSTFLFHDHNSILHSKIFDQNPDKVQSSTIRINMKNSNFSDMAHTVWSPFTSSQ
jgi:hypothetical protein